MSISDLYELDFIALFASQENRAELKRIQPSSKEPVQKTLDFFEIVISCRKLTNKICNFSD